MPLHALTREQISLAGGKAANLGELLRGGFPVPPGWCVTTGGYLRVARAADLDGLLDELASLGSGNEVSEPTHHPLSGNPPAGALRPPVPRSEGVQGGAALLPAGGKESPLSQGERGLGVRGGRQERLAEVAGAIRQRILTTPVPPEVERAIRDAVAASGETVPVAVRSSATAEDLPGASFAGQQDTILNVRGADAVLEAVRRCWASLWTDRAVAYRARVGIDPRTVSLAVVVQRLVDAAVAGVLFTANPVTGRRRQVVVDASPGLGEAVVSGAVDPDRFVVDPAGGAVLERRLGSKAVAVRASESGGTRRVEVSPSSGAPCLTDAQLRALAALGMRAEAHFGAPQDVEFALDGAGTLWLTQSRPITTLFPLPAGAPPADGDGDGDVRVYFDFNVAQGVFRPLTPMGLQAFRLLGTSIATLGGFPVRDPVVGPPAIVEAAGRMFWDVTPVVRWPLGRRVGAALLARGEARSGAQLRALLTDPRLAPRPTSWRHVLAVVARVLARTRLPLRVLRALAHPAGARRDAWEVGGAVVAAGHLPAGADATARVDRFEALLRTWPARIVPQVFPLLVAGLGSLALAWRLLGRQVSAAERDAVTRALPHNPTTEMDLDLWALAGRVRADGAARAALGSAPPGALVAEFRKGALPAVLQEGLGAFLARYGHRAVAEIDLGLPRWAEDPTHLLGALTNYLALDEGATPPDAQFRRAGAEAEASVRELVRRASRRSPLRGAAVRFLLGRGRALAGTRELPKFLVVLLLARARASLAPVGDELTAAGRLDAPDGLWFLTLPEVRAGLAGADLRPLERERRATYTAELGRRHLPRFLLSDGSEPGAGVSPAAAEGGLLTGVPASAGQVTGRARVVLEPAGARLHPGEILVAPSTDPGWTPLFLTAGGLVMEMGGAMSHGAVVAREYGIPAVVGVADATERIAGGALLTVDGTAGTVAFAEPESAGGATRSPSGAP